MRKLILVVISLLLLTTSCFAANWQWLGSNANMGVFVDTSSIKFDMSKTNRIINRDRIYFWVKYEYDEAYAQKNIDPPNTKYIIAHDGLDFKANEMIYPKAIMYDKDGNSIGEDNPVLHWQPIVPGSLGDSLQKYLADYVSKHVEEIEQRTQGN